VGVGVKVFRLSLQAVEIGGPEDAERRKFALELSDSDVRVIHRVTFRVHEPVDCGGDDWFLRLRD
jgi:hypothetical protein